MRETIRPSPAGKTTQQLTAPRVVETKDKKPSQAALLKELIKMSARQVVGPFLYPELEDHWQDYLSNKPLPDFDLLKQQLISNYRLQVRPDSFSYRREQVECVRYVLDTAPNNCIVQAPTGQGKTEIALLCAARQLRDGGRVFFSLHQ
jgi:CRISPR/Cas system-associated endonuclease/helicase Cas3